MGFGTETFREYYDPSFPLTYRLVERPIYHCYYLGQYPWHWDYENYCPRSPGPSWPPWEMPKEIRDLIDKAPREKWTGPRLGPYEGTPGIPGVTGVTLENLSEEDLILFHGKQKYTNYAVQVAFQEWLDTRLKNCIAQNYPPPGWKPKRQVNNMDWPGKPIKSLDPPIPMGRRALPPGIEQTTTNVTASMYFTPVGREDGLTLDLEIT
jgi:hypothetical protein